MQQVGNESHTWPGQVDNFGRLLIPAESRKELGWHPGEKVVIESDGDSLRVMSLEQFTNEVRELFGRSAPDEPYWSDELIAERRREAQRERRSD